MNDKIYIDRNSRLPEVKVTAFSRQGMSPYQKVKAKATNPYEYKVEVNPISETDVHLGINGASTNRWGGGGGLLILLMSMLSTWIQKIHG